MAEESDEQLLARLKSEPETAFRALYDRHSSALLRFIYRFTGSQQSAEEILHDIFMELLNGKYRDAGNLKSWLFTLAKNKSLNFLRGRARETALGESLEGEEANNQEEQHSLETALEKLAQSESRMPADLRETWGLRRQGLGYQQIADQLSIPIGTVKSRFHRLVLYLREELGK